MTASPRWPRVGEPDRWTHLNVRLGGDAPSPDQAAPALTFEIWSRYPAIVIREVAEERLVREVRANNGSSASLDLERQLCLAKTGLDPQGAYEAAIAVVAGPVAELYGDGSLPRGWRSRKVRDTVAYYNDGRGALRQVTIDPATGLPLEAITVDGRWRWSISVAGNDPPPAAPDVTEWAKESHERTELPTDSGPVEHIRYRSSSLLQPLEFVAAERGAGPTRVVIQRDLEPEVAHFMHPDGRPARVLAGDHGVAEQLVGRVAEQLVGRAAERPGADRSALGAAEEAEDAEDAPRWDGRINALVGSITDQPD